MSPRACEQMVRPGDMPITYLMEEDCMTITAGTKVCAVIGDPVGHSLSPQIHNAAFGALGLDFAYVACHVKRGDTEAALRGVRALGIRGLSVTIPHKLDVIPHLDALDPVAQNMGSVNTVVNDDGRLTGCSTDGPGALRALEASGAPCAGRRILLVGSGGAARALAFTLATLDPLPELQVLGIEPKELEGLAQDLDEKTSLRMKAGALNDKSLSASMEEAEVVVHATPIGMAPKVDATVIPASLIRKDQVIFDVVYTPLETKLLREAAAVGARTVPGLGMFVHQAAIQFELWTGRDAPVDLMTSTVAGALAAES